MSLVVRRGLVSGARAMSTHSFGVAFDIDGVLYRGSKIIPSAKSTLLRLRKERIPFLLLTNNGGVPYEMKAKQLTKKLDVDIPEHQVRQLVQGFPKSLVFF